MQNKKEIVVAAFDLYSRHLTKNNLILLSRTFMNSVK